MRREEKLRLKTFFFKLYAQNPEMPIREYARIVGVSHTTIRRWREEFMRAKERKTQHIHTLYLKMPPELKERLRGLLLYSKEEKTRTRTIPKAKIYKFLELDLSMLGVKNKTQGLKLISHFVEQEFGSWEKLEAKRRPRKELPKFRTPKGKLERFIGLMELDATGYTHDDGTTIYVFLAQDTYTGYIFDEFVITVKSKDGPKHHNKAFNSRNLAKYMMHLFTTYGVPEKIRIDGDMSLNNEYLTSALKRLGIKLNVVRLANQKLIERTIGELKNWLRSFKDVEKVRERVKSARESYNRSEHKYEHFKEPVVPQNLLPLIYKGYSHKEEEEIRHAFMEQEVRSVQNNTLRWDGYLYTFIMPAKLREGEYGRKPSSRKVLVKRHVDNASHLEVYDLKTKEFLGYAQLYSQDVPTVDPTERKEMKDAQKRAKKRENKLFKEITQIKQAPQQEEEPSIKLSELLKEETQEEKTSSVSSVWEILQGGENDA